MFPLRGRVAFGEEGVFRGVVLLVLPPRRRPRSAGRWAGPTNARVPSSARSAWVSAPWPLVGYMTRHARIAHERTYALIADELVGATDGW